MQKLKILILFYLLLIDYCAFAIDKNCNNRIVYEVIPMPQEIEYRRGNDFVLTNSTEIVYCQCDSMQYKNALFLQRYIQEKTGWQLRITNSLDRINNSIVLRSDLSYENKEAYQISVDPDNITINGASSAGTFYGIQTFYKTMISLECDGSEILFPQVLINDYPRFGYRGVMLDVSRHFFPVSFIKEFIDILALHNINRFHWHLTNDQGWRVQIDSYPLLNSVGSARKNVVINPKNACPEKDGNIYGPYYYTKNEIREVIKYAKDRFIEIIPEIDVPGHTMAVLAAYPELGCTGGPYEVANSRGIYHDVLCLGNRHTYDFLYNVFNEILDLFPCQYIHIGGDECPKTRWRECPKCREMAARLSIDVDNLQAYMVSFLEKIISDRNKIIIGWDEIINDQVPKSTVIMGWRGINASVKAARKGYNTIMTPNSYMYFDYAQNRDTENSPISMGNYLPLEKVYSFEPFDIELSDQEKSKILGVQANLWTEFIPDEKTVELMLLPRLDALSEIQWTLPEKKDYKSFLNRLPSILSFYKDKGYNFAKHVYDVHFETIEKNDKICVSLSTMGDAPIYYSLDGSIPSQKSVLYDGTPVVIDKTTVVRAIAVRDDVVCIPQEILFDYNKATNKKIISNSLKKNELNRMKQLVDGILGSSNYRDGNWVLFDRDNLNVTIDLGEIEEVSSVNFRTNIRLDNRVFGPSKLVVSVSKDDKDYKKVLEKNYPEIQMDTEIGIRDLKASFKPVKSRFVRITISKLANVPDWHRSKGLRTLMYIDEIRIN